MVTFFQVSILAILISAAWSHTLTRPLLDDDQQKLQISKTTGQVWPWPQQIQTKETVVTLSPETFVFTSKSECDIVLSAFYRYYELIFNPPRSGFRRKSVNGNSSPHLLKNVRGQLDRLEVVLTGSCEKWPQLDMDEQYTLEIDSEEMPQKAQLVATTPWGVLRGLETFSQLVYYEKDSGLFLANSTYILDFPRFSHRGILIDTSRHYVPLHVIKENLDAMAYNKMNVLHWHIVDDQSFPYQSKAFPEMSEKGSYNPVTHIYTTEDVNEVLLYAQQRGIRVLPEFDTPGHTLSWGPGVPNLLTQCFTSEGQPDGYGPINPSLNSTYTFLQQFFSEVVDGFPDKFVHLGGDEVSFDCWESNKDISDFMNKMNYTKYTELESFYIVNLLKVVGGLNSSYIVWQEVFDNGIDVKNDTVIEVWKDNPMSELNNITKKGLQAILASCWYLDYISYGSDWKQYYKCEPLAFNGTAKQYSLVMGGEACLWGEFVDATNLISRMWPRASATAERLWSNQSVTDIKAAAPRLEEHRCRLLTRGINAEPQNGPGFCDADYLV